MPNRKVYIITAGDYSDYHIVAVFMNKEQAEKFHNAYNRRINQRYGDKCYINEFPVGMDIEYAATNVYCVEREKSGELYAYGIGALTYDRIPDIGKVKIVGDYLECHVIVPMNIDEQCEYAEKVAADAFAKFLADEAGIT